MTRSGAVIFSGSCDLECEASAQQGYLPTVCVLNSEAPETTNNKYEVPIDRGRGSGKLVQPIPV